MKFRGRRLLVVFGCVLALAACDSDRATRSPDLPADTLNSIDVNCTPTTIAVGQMGQCTATCTYNQVQSDGSVVVTPPGACRNINWVSATPGIVSIDGGGKFTGVAPGGPVNVGGCENGTCDTVPVTVSAACPVAGVAPDIRPPSQNLPPNARSQLQAFLTFTDGSTVNVAQQSGMNWSVPTQNFVSICNTNGGCGAGNGKGTVSTLAVGGPVTVTGTYTQANCTAIPSGTATVTVVPATLISGGLCVEPIPINAQPGNPRLDFSGCRADTGACLVTPVSIPVGGMQQFRARGRFNDGQECSLTQSASTAWSSSNSNFFTVNNTTSKGLATGVAPGTANAVAMFGGQTGQHPLSVFDALVLGNNSLEVGVPIYCDMDGDVDVNDSLGKFFCIGYADLVGGLQNSPDLPGAQQLQANARFCPQSAIINGACTGPFTPPVGTQAVNARIPSNWEAQEGYWNGNDCESLAGDPTGLNESPAQVGNTFTVTPPVDNKGLVSPRGSVRLGTACIKATYTPNPLMPANSDFDGATALVLPITNDVVLQDDEIDDAVELCNTLAPLFLLGGANGGAGAITQILSAVSEILNPVLTGLTQGNEPGGPIPTSDIIDQVATALADNLTETLLAADALGPVVTGVNTGVYAPLNCALGALLNALLSQDPAAAQAIQSCPPDAGGLPVPGLPIP